MACGVGIKIASALGGVPAAGEAGCREASASSKAESSATCSGVAVEMISIITETVSVMLSPGGAHR
jgi:hypothetical protein